MQYNMKKCIMGICNHVGKLDKIILKEVTQKLKVLCNPIHKKFQLGYTALQGSVDCSRRLVPNARARLCVDLLWYMDGLCTW